MLDDILGLKATEHGQRVCSERGLQLPDAESHAALAFAPVLTELLQPQGCSTIRITPVVYGS